MMNTAVRFGPVTVPSWVGGPVRVPPLRPRGVAVNAGGDGAETKVTEPSAERAELEKTPGLASVDFADDREPNQFEKDLEDILFNTRYLAAFGVAGSMLGSVTMFFKGLTVVSETFIEMIVKMSELEADKFNPAPEIVAAVDDFLLATVLLVLGLGLYELFISELDAMTAANPLRLRSTPTWLRTRGLDDLKKKLAKVVIMSLLVKALGFFEHIDIDTAPELLQASTSIVLCAGAMYLSGLGKQD